MEVMELAELPHCAAPVGTYFSSVSFVLRLLVWGTLAVGIGAPGTFPVITLTPPNPHILTVGDVWEDPGYSCLDAEDGELAPTREAFTRGTLTYSADGLADFTLTYTCNDKTDKTQFAKAERTIIVRGPPVLSLAGPSTAVIPRGDFGGRANSYCYQSDGTTQQPSDGTTSDMQMLSQLPSTADTSENKALCLSLCKEYQLLNSGATACELRVAGATTPGCYVHKEADVFGTGATVVKYYCWKAELYNPGACCHNYLGTKIEESSDGYPSSTNNAGQYQVLYHCTDIISPSPASRVDVPMKLVIDEPPALLLQGSANTKTTRGVGYVDEGVLCQDSEDGAIVELPLNTITTIRITQVTASGFVGDPNDNDLVNMFASMDGKTDSSASGCRDCHVTVADALATDASLHWLRLDLGHLRIVHKVIIHKTAGVWTVLVGSSLLDSPECGKTPTATGLQTTPCKAPLAGRYVFVKHSFEMTVCKVDVEGSAGPTSPSQFSMSSACGTQAGKYHLSGSVEGWPTYKLTHLLNGDDSATDVVMKWDGDRYKLMKDGSNEVRTASSFSPLPGATWSPSGTCHISYDPADACTWLFGFSSTDDKVECADGTLQDSAGACSSPVDLGGLAKCPPNKPQMCDDPSSGVSCRVSCIGAGGGIRSCGEDGSPGVIENSPFFLGSWTGTKNDITGDVGISFFTKTKLRVTHLGRFNVPAITMDLVVTLWSADSQLPLATAIVGSSSSDDGNYKYVDLLGNAVELAAGREYRISQRCVNGMADRFYDGYESATSLFGATNYRYATMGSGVRSLDGQNGYPSAESGPYHRMGMVTFKYQAPAARIEKAGYVDINIPGVYYVVFTCVDTLGQRAASTREITVGCEGPNPIGLHGGNNVDCDIQMKETTKSSFDECKIQCLSDASCEAAVFYLHDTTPSLSRCQSHKKCSGRYFNDAAFDRKVGYCKRVDHPPSVALEASDCCVNQGDTWNEGPVSCRDNEDAVPPTVVKVNTVLTSVAGLFTQTYSCTDTANQVGALAFRNITVRKPCDVPFPGTGAGQIENGYSGGMCEHGNTAVAHGDTCKQQCNEPDWVPVQAILRCTSTGDQDWQSDWERSFECGEKPCLMPQGAYTFETHHVAKGHLGTGMACTQGYKVVTGATCNPNCRDGYLATHPTNGSEVTGLYCNVGFFDDCRVQDPDVPSSYCYKCRLPAGAPQFIFPKGKPDVEWCEMQWAGATETGSTGQPNGDCIFAGWEIESRQTIKGFEEDEIIAGKEMWAPTEGCRMSDPNQAGSLTLRTTLECKSTNRTEGATYEFRIRETCTKANMNSPWTVTSPAVKMRIVYPPERLFNIPTDDVNFDPAQLMLAWTVEVRLTDHSDWGDPADKYVAIEKSGEWCFVEPTVTYGEILEAPNPMPLFNKTAVEILDGTASGASFVQLTGKRILILKPPDGWFSPGCSFNATVGYATSQTVDTPSKPAPYFQWNFSYIDVQPEFYDFVTEYTTTDMAKFKLKWTLMVTQNCTLRPLHVPDCVTCGLTCSDRCTTHYTEYKDQSTDESWIEYQVFGLFPGTTYHADCLGYKVGKWWIPTAPADPLRMEFKTKDDNDATIGSFTVNVTANCSFASPSKESVIVRQGDFAQSWIQTSEFVRTHAVGYTVQILDYKDACRTPPGSEMNHDEVAQMIFDSHVVPNSSFARLDWDFGADYTGHGPQHSFKYTKSVGTQAIPIKTTLRFRICSLAAILSPGQYSCTQYQINVQCVDIRFLFGNFTTDLTMTNTTGVSNAYKARLLEDTIEETDVDSASGCTTLGNCPEKLKITTAGHRDNPAERGFSPRYSNLAVNPPHGKPQAAGDDKLFLNAFSSFIEDVTDLVTENNFLSERVLAELEARHLSTVTTTLILTVGVGSGTNIGMVVDQLTFDWTKATFHLGPILGSSSFKLHAVRTGTTDPEQQIQLALTGQGTRLPLVLEWSMVTFQSQFSVSFTLPEMTVPPTAPDIHAISVLQVDLTNVPKVSGLASVGISGHGYGSPASHIQLGVYKFNRTENLCQATTFPDVNDWSKAQCMLAPAALSDIEVVLFVKDFVTQEFIKYVSTTVTGQVTYKKPTHIGLKDAGGWAESWDGSILLAQVVSRSVAEVYVAGDKLPSVANLQMGGARLPGYEMKILGDTEIDACSKITFENASMLKCLLHKCINITAFKEKPKMRMYLGDLSSVAPIPGSLTIPRPNVLSFSPETIHDVGRNRTIEFWGINFGERECKDIHLDATQLLGSPSGMHITVGEWVAPCEILFQNNTYLICKISAPVSDPRSKTYVGAGLPPPQRSSIQGMTFRLGKYMDSVNVISYATPGRRMGGNGSEWGGRRMAVAANGALELKVTVTLMPCAAGWRRVALDLDECEPCALGRYNTLTSADWPLTCDTCPAGTYSDEIGASACKACPANTYAAQPAISIASCLCKEGHYSQFYNESSKQALPGTECVNCNSLVEPPLKDQKCGEDPPVSPSGMCDAPTFPVCVAPVAGVAYYSVCKVYCPGGTHWPKAKAGFYNLGTKTVGGGEVAAEEGRGAATSLPKRSKPDMVPCDPPEACLNWNVCSFRYTGYGCGACTFGYFRDDKSGKCVACGDAQRFGMIIMAGMVVLMSFGGLFGTGTFMRLQADMVFKNEVVNVGMAIVSQLSKVKALAAVFKSRDKRISVEVQRYDVGCSYRFASSGDFGMVFRVDSRGQIHVAGLLPDCPVRGLIEAHWKLVSVNGHRPHARTEEEVKTFLHKQRFPMRFIFVRPKGGLGDGKMFENFDDDRKMGVVLLGVMNAFSQVSMFDFEWPPMFQRLAEIAERLSFSFNFFKPECSVAAPYIFKWLGFMAIPYMMMIPLIVSYASVAVVTLPGWRGVTLKTKSWLLRNAFARCTNMCIILLLPFHLETLLVPFACVERGEGTYFVSATPDTLCSFTDPRYAQMLMISGIGSGVMLCFYSLLIFALWKSFIWQFGYSKVRDSIPFYVGMVEVSVFGQRGYVRETRRRVMTNLAAVHTFDAKQRQFQKRIQLLKAVDLVGPRSRRVAENSGRTGAHQTSFDPSKNDADGAGQDEEDNAKSRMEILQGKDHFVKSKHMWPAKPDGNVITYGWIVIVNMFWRQVLSLITIKMSEGNLVVIGAAALMLIYAGNITLLLIFKPYKSRKVSETETIMLSCLFLVLWCITLQDLLSNHVNVHLFADTLKKVNLAIDTLAVCIFILVVYLPMRVVHETVSRTISSFRSADTLLNDIYMMTVGRASKAKLEKEKEAYRVKLEDEAAEAGLLLPPALGRKLTTVQKALERINTSQLCEPTDEQRKRFRNFVSVVRELPDPPPKKFLEKDDEEVEQGSLHHFVNADEQPPKARHAHAHFSEATESSSVALGASHGEPWKRSGTVDSQADSKTGASKWALSPLMALAASKKDAAGKDEAPASGSDGDEKKPLFSKW